MTRSLTGKVALVTGAGKGIGAGIAKAMAAAGVSVVVNFASDRPGAERVVADIKAAGGSAFAIQANVSVVAEVQRLLAETVTTFGPLDILVNNASVFAFASLEQTTDEQLHKMLDTNLWGTIVTCREALKEHLFAEAVATFGPLDILVNNASVFAFALLEQTTDEQLHKMLDTNLWGTIVTCREALKHFGKDGGSNVVLAAGHISHINPATGHLCTRDVNGDAVANADCVIPCAARWLNPYTKSHRNALCSRVSIDQCSRSDWPSTTSQDRGHLKCDDC